MIFWRFVFIDSFATWINSDDPFVSPAVQCIVVALRTPHQAAEIIIKIKSIIREIDLGNYCWHVQPYFQVFDLVALRSNTRVYELKAC